MMQLCNPSPLHRWALAVTAAFLLVPPVVKAPEQTSPDGYAEAREEMIAAMSASDFDVVESLIDPEGRIAFSLARRQSDVSLAQWFGTLRAMIEGGTRVAIQD